MVCGRTALLFFYWNKWPTNTNLTIKIREQNSVCFLYLIHEQSIIHTQCTFSLVTTEQKSTWASHPIWRWWQREKSPPPTIKPVVTSLIPPKSNPRCHCREVTCQDCKQGSGPPNQCDRHCAKGCMALMCDTTHFCVTISSFKNILF
jgi:hypothetical protein